jgi:hypothetical protein
MNQLDIHHEDVLMKMFMYLLDGDARQWYRSLLTASISSLRKFHSCFRKHCKFIFLVELLLKDCCEKIEGSISNNEQANFYGATPLSYSKIHIIICNEGFQTCHEEAMVSKLAKEVSFVEPIIYYDRDKEINMHHHVHENSIVLNYNETYDNQEVFQEDQETIVDYDHHSLQDVQFFESPIYDEYHDLDDKLYEKKVSFYFFEVFNQQFHDNSEK